MTLGECVICKTYLCNCSKRIEMTVEGTKRSKTPKEAGSYHECPISLIWDGTHTGTISQTIQIKVEKPT
jgi:hypothetical protein